MTVSADLDAKMICIEIGRTGLFLFPFFARKMHRIKCLTLKCTPNVQLSGVFLCIMEIEKIIIIA